MAAKILCRISHVNLLLRMWATCFHQFLHSAAENLWTKAPHVAENPLSDWLPDKSWVWGPQCRFIDFMAWNTLGMSKGHALWTTLQGHGLETRGVGGLWELCVRAPEISIEIDEICKLPSTCNYIATNKINKSCLFCDDWGRTWSVMPRTA